MPEHVYTSSETPVSASDPLQKNDLSASARRIGSALGRAVVAVREAGSEENIGNNLEAAAETAGKYMDRARSRADDMKYHARFLARKAVRDYPLQTILVAGVVGVLAGIGIRIWREDRG